MDTLEISPLTSHLNVEDCPRWMALGSTVNCVTAGAGGFGGGAGAGAGTGGGGGVAAGAFFLQPANTTRLSPILAIRILCLLLNMNVASSFH
jgi:hypothetical protein